MNTSEFKKLIEENSNLLGSEMFTYLIGELETGGIDEKIMSNIVAEIKKAKSALKKVDNIKNKGNKIYTDGVEKVKIIETKIKKEILNKNRQSEENEHSDEISDAENLISNL